MIARARKADHARTLHADLVGWSMLQGEGCLHHRRLLHVVAQLPCSLVPPGHRAFIQPNGMDDRLARTPVAAQGHDDHHQMFFLTPSFTQRAPMHAERLSTRLACLPLALCSMTHQMARSAFPSCRTFLVRATELGRIWWDCCAFHPSAYPTDAFSLPQQDVRPPERGVLPVFLTMILFWGILERERASLLLCFYFVYISLYVGSSKAVMARTHRRQTDKACEGIPEALPIPRNVIPSPLIWKSIVPRQTLLVSGGFYESTRSSKGKRPWFRISPG